MKIQSISISFGRRWRWWWWWWWWWWHIEIKSIIINNNNIIIIIFSQLSAEFSPSPSTSPNLNRALNKIFLFEEEKRKPFEFIEEFSLFVWSPNIEFLLFTEFHNSVIESNRMCFGVRFDPKQQFSKSEQNTEYWFAAAAQLCFRFIDDFLSFDQKKKDWKKNPKLLTFGINNQGGERGEKMII